MVRLSLCKTCAWIYFFSVVPQSVIRLILVDGALRGTEKRLQNFIRVISLCMFMYRWLTFDISLCMLIYRWFNVWHCGTHMGCLISFVFSNFRCTLNVYYFKKQKHITIIHTTMLRWPIKTCNDFDSFPQKVRLLREREREREIIINDRLKCSAQNHNP